MLLFPKLKCTTSAICNSIAKIFDNFGNKELLKLLLHISQKKKLIVKFIQNILMLFSLDHCGHIIDSDWYDNESDVILFIVVGPG